MAITLERCGIPMATAFQGKTCSWHEREHPIRAEDMKDFLASAAMWPYLPNKLELRHGVTWRDFKDRPGICVWRNFYNRTNRNDMSGDHVDLWTGSEVVVGELDYFVRSPEVWFWHIP